MNVKIYKCFIASPSDTSKEREICDKVFQEINKTLGELHHFRIEPKKWESDTHPSFGQDGQDVINKQIGNDYEIFIGIMWAKFGTKTKRAESGTEEEFNIAYERHANKEAIEIMMYFNNASLTIDEINTDQLTKVKQFKSKVAALGGLYYQYNGVDDFETKLRNHLSSFFKNKLSENYENGVIVDESIRFKFINPDINSEYQLHLNNMEVLFAHNIVDKIGLEDIYVPPDLQKSVAINKTNLQKTTNLAILCNAIDSEGIKFILLGNDLAGKTAASKYVFTKYFSQSLIPVLINGADIHNNIKIETIEKLIESKIIEQYSKPFSLNEIGHDKILLIIDDFHKSAKGLNRYWNILIKNIEKKFRNIVLTGSSFMSIDPEYNEPFKNFTIYSILEFGPILRKELVHKWMILGIDEKFSDKNELLRKQDNAIQQIKTAIGKNYFPVYPFYILSLLQALEGNTVLNPNYSIHGFYYENLINGSFAKFISDKKSISLFYNYLTYFCYYLFDKQVNELSIQEFKEFHNSYCRMVDITYSVEEIMRTFNDAHLLHVNQKVRVKEKYVYYFFVAKYLADNINNTTNAKEIIRKMSMRVFRDDYASIILFVTHLSKDKFILEELIKNANSIFSQIEPAKLDDEIEGINSLVERIPQQVVESVDVDTKRKAELIEEEEAEKREREFINERSSYNNFGLDDDISVIDFLAWLTMAFKTIDILGQIAKKHWGAMDGELKVKLVNATYNLGLRFLGYYLQLLQTNSDEIVEHIKQIVKEKHIKDSYSLKKSAEEEARDYIFRLCFMATFGTIKRVSNAVSDEKLKNTFAKILTENPYNSVKLIDLGIKLIYTNLPIEQIKENKEDMKSNNLCLIALQSLVVDHTYMFDTTHTERSQLNAIFGVTIKEQIQIGSSSKVKK